MGETPQWRRLKQQKFISALPFPTYGVFLPSVSFLSNLRSPHARSTGHPGEPVHPPLCRHARVEEVEAGLRFILGSAARPANDAQIAEFLRFSTDRGIDSGQLWIAEQNDRLLWAILPVPSPGRTLLLFAPASLNSATQRVAAAFLTEEVLEEQRVNGAHLAQVLLEAGERSLFDLYTGLGFASMAELIYLQAMPRHSLTFPPLPGSYWWKTYSAETHDAFAKAIAATYRQSLDCPALNGVRDIEDVIAGHKATGHFDPRLWFVLCNGTDCQGVLLLNRTAQNNSLELVYVGLVPEARGQDLGDLLMRHALAVTANENCSRLTLAVDADNAPALKLYYRHGLKRLTTRSALMRDLRSPTPLAPR
jgi:mycothiol synthase